MAEWQIELGIAEHRALLIDGGEAIAARIEWPGGLAAGLVGDAVLASRSKGSSRGTAVFPDGEEALVDGLPRDASEGATIRLEVTRAAMTEAGRGKLARARPSASAKGPAPSLESLCALTPHKVRRVSAFPAGLWEDLHSEAWAGEVQFPGGSLNIAPTPAMTVIDVDGTLSPAQLAAAAARTVADAIHRFDMAGNIGIDFPTLASKEDRRAVDSVLDQCLSQWPHERTAMNGFGFVQIIARQTHPSLVARMAFDRAGAAARLLLRRAEQVREPGALELLAHPRLKASVRPQWEAELARRTGRQVRWRTDEVLALYGASAQAVPL